MLVSLTARNLSLRLTPAAGRLAGTAAPPIHASITVKDPLCLEEGLFSLALPGIILEDMARCLGPLDVQALLLGGQSEEEIAGARGHLESCAACRELVERLLSSSPTRVAAEALSLPAGADLTAEAWALGPYRVLRELGRGGQGQVYLAEDTRLGRKVALKVLSARFGDARSGLERFRREALTLSRLDHPGICAVYDAGEVDGIAYIAMRHVEGQPLSRIIAAGHGRPPLAAAEITDFARIVERAARALHCAHEAGVVHRDVKPGNILVAAGGEPLLLDFGLAHAEAGGQATLTRSGDVLGTPAYLSPEELAGGTREVDRRTDVYSLGVTLFQCLTRRLPFEAESREALYRQILTAELPDPKLDCPRLPRDLKTVLATALEKEPARRYATALDLAEDLRRVRMYEPIRARPAGKLLRLRRWSQRHPALATSIVGTFLLLATGLAVALVLLGKVSQERAEKGTALKNTEAALRRAEGLRLAAESAAARPTDPALALLLAVEAGKRQPGLLATNAALEALDALRELRTLKGHRESLSSVEWRPDGKLLLTASYDGTAALWDPESGERRRVLQGHDGVVIRAKFSPDSKRVLTASWDATARVWETDTGKERCVLRGHRESVNAIAWSPDGLRVLTASGDGTAALWDAGTGQRFLVLEGHAGPLFGAEFAPVGGRMLTWSIESLRVWEAEGGRLVFTKPATEYVPVEGRFSHDGERVLVVASGQASVLRAEDGAEVLVLRGHTANVNRALFFLDGTRIATSANDGTVRIWDAESGESLQVVPVDDPAANLGGLSHDGSRLVVQIQHFTARVYSTRSRRMVSELCGHRESLTAIVFSPDGKRLATSSFDNTARLWRVEEGLIPAEIRSDGPPLHCRSPDGALVVPVTDEAWAQVLDSRTGTEVARLVGHAQQIKTAVFDAAGARIATTSQDGTIRLWEAATGKEVLRLACGEHLAHDISFSPDGARLASGHSGGFVRLWDAATGRRLREVAAHGNALTRISFSPDGSRILTASVDMTARVLDAATGGVLLTLEGHRSTLNTARFSADGSFIATASHDNTARLWDASTGAALAVVKGHGKFTYSADLTADGRGLRVTSENSMVKTWPLDALAAARAALPRDFTPDELDQYEIGTPEERSARRAGDALRSFLGQGGAR